MASGDHKSPWATINRHFVAIGAATRTTAKILDRKDLIFGKTMLDRYSNINV
jgi:hypothetical protein